MKLKNICKTCKKEFETNTSKNQKYCSLECYYTAIKNGSFAKIYNSRRQNFYKCSYCGKEIKSRSKKRNRDGSKCENIFCDRTCYDLFRRKDIIKKCLYCGKEFEAIGPKKKNIFCDDKCRRLYTAKIAKKICPVCNKEFYNSILLDRTLGYENPCCSEKCSSIYKRQNEIERRIKISNAFTGSKHPGWKGGISEQKEIITSSYRGHNWSLQKRFAKERDNFTCQVCHKTYEELKADGKKLEVHHKIPFKYFDNYLEANELNNLITVCPKCHRYLDLLYKKEHQNENKENCKTQPVS